MVTPKNENIFIFYVAVIIRNQLETQKIKMFSIFRVTVVLYFMKILSGYQGRRKGGGGLGVTHPPPSKTRICWQMKLSSANLFSARQLITIRNHEIYMYSRGIEVWGTIVINTPFSTLKIIIVFIRGVAFFSQTSVAFSFVDNEMCRHFVFLWTCFTRLTCFMFQQYTNLAILLCSTVFL